MKNKPLPPNYLEKVPVRSEKIGFSTDEKGIVTLEIENKGVFNRFAQLLFKKPKISYVHLDENGSFVWLQIDGERSIFAIAPLVEEHFGEAAHPLYERLAKFFQILESYRFIKWKE
ncbi:MAG: PqqD family protein [Clostridia bacterium]|nr:PqqD family protein [Clostridia bacterium]MBR3594179.1 PqqD family protein [Clostridia bacterium]